MAEEVIELGTYRGGSGMVDKKKGAGAGLAGKSVQLNLGSRIDEAIDLLARRKAGGLAGPRPGLGGHARPGFARPGFGNFRSGELGGAFGSRSFLGAVIPPQVKPVPVILGTVVGVGFNSAVGRLLTSPRVGINANPLLAKVLLAGGGVVLHVLAKTNFTLGFMLGQFPGLIEAGVSAIMDMALGESEALRGLGAAGDISGISKQALAELQALRRKLESPVGMESQPAGVPMGVRAQAA
jgi:hypothetical protein